MAMRILIALAATLLLLRPAQGQLYFPPNATTWDTLAPSDLGWCTDSIPQLYDFLEQSNTKAFLLLKDGRIVLEKYFGTFTQDSLWYWASAGKTVTAFLIGKAQEEGFLSITDTSSTYLGTGWTSCPPNKEEMITVRHQLTMTTGLDDGVPDVDCTDPSCLQYLADAGTRWAYHNAPYTLLDGVINAATGQTINAYLFNKLSLTIGLYGAYLQLGYNNVLFSTPRAMARFGLMMLADGTWDGATVMADQNYLNAMRTPSQNLNESYGYLWWLNGQPSYMLPGFQLVIPGPLMPHAPQDAYNAMGKNGQLLNISPSNGLVLVRMGELPGGLFVPNLYNDTIWQHVNAILCSTTSIPPAPATVSTAAPHPYPDPATDELTWPRSGTPEVRAAWAITMDGRRFRLSFQGDHIQLGRLAPGTYVLERQLADGRVERAQVNVVR